jgi:acetyl-CoA carboxylase biotin carboxyl carrier protein
MRSPDANPQGIASRLGGRSRLPQYEMTVEEIKELIHVVNESGIAELEVQRGENRVRIRRNTTPHPQEIVLAQAAPAVVAASPMGTITQAPAAALTAPAQPTAAAPNIESEQVFVKSPIVGTYYDAPTPGSPPFVKVGDRVSPGQVLCIIESMKLMNEIEAEIAGTIVSKLVENGRPVEYGEALFGVQPA